MLTELMVACQDKIEATSSATLSATESRKPKDTAWRLPSKQHSTPKFTPSSGGNSRADDGGYQAREAKPQAKSDGAFYVKL